MKSMLIWAASAAFLLFASPAGAAPAADVSGNHLQGPGGYYNPADRSGLCSIGSDGVAHLLTDGGTGDAITEADGMNVTLGLKANAASAASSSTAMSTFRQLHNDLIAPTPSA